MVTSSDSVSQSLGSLIKEYKSSIQISFDLIFGAASVILGTALIISMKISGQSFVEMIELFLVFLFLILLGIGTLFLWFNRRDLKVQLFEKGFLYHKGGRVRVFRWEDIESVKEQSNKIYMMTFFPIGTHCVYTVKKHNGAVVQLNNDIKNIKNFGDVVLEETFKVLMPKACKIYEDGGILDFGGLKLSYIGINNGKETLLWNKVKSVELDEGYVVIKKRDELLKWASVPVSEILNAHVLLSLIQKNIALKE